MGENQKVSAEQLAKIRRLADFDLIMLISEIHDHGWPRGGTHARDDSRAEGW